MSDQSGREPFAADEGTNLDVPRVCRLGEVRRGHQSHTPIDDNALGMEAGTLGGFQIERARIIIQFRQSPSGPLLGLKSLSEPSKHLFGLRSIGRWTMHAVLSGRNRVQADERHSAETRTTS